MYALLCRANKIKQKRKTDRKNDRLAEEEKQKQKSKKQLSNDADSKHEHDHAETLIGNTRNAFGDNIF